MSHSPVDLSFQELSSVTDAIFKMPRTDQRNLTRNSEGKYESGALRLSYNQLIDTVDLIEVLDHILVEPLNICWLDLSFNEIMGIDLVLCELKELRVLYLHSNNISDLMEVDKLEKLQHLHTITLHGNPMESTAGYRNHVISVLPHLKSLDFSSVTHSDKSGTRFCSKPPKPGNPPKPGKTPKKRHPSVNK